MKMRDTAEQTIGAIVDEICKPRITEMNGQLQATANQLHGELSIQGKCLHRALEAMGKFRNLWIIRGIFWAVLLLNMAKLLNK